jgi:peptidyl-dipeptidase Dcp
LDASEISAAASAAADRGLTGKYLITLILPTSQPHLSVLANADVRGRVLAASRSRGSRGGTFDNRALVLEIAKVRSQRAALLGFESHAAWVTADETAQNPQRVAEMLGKLAPAAARNARGEHTALEKLAGTEVSAADWAFYSEKVRAEQYNVDTTQMRPYFEAERVLRDGVFFAATKLYGVTFSERYDLPAYHPDVRIFEVTNEDGTEVGLYTLDLYTRDSKRGGAWMNSLISQSDLLGHPVIVTNNLNVPKPAAGEVTLLTYDEVNTLFHEFGHALHGLFARVTYPKFSGTNTYRDFVEFPSQANEMWMLWPEVLDNYAKHYKTGESMPREIVERIHASAAFNEGFLTSEYLAAALIDQAWHRIGADDDVTDVAAFEAQALADVGLDNSSVPSRYSSTYFQHIFANSAYDAGYYSYIWSEVLDADTVEWFTENGGLTRANGDRFRSRLLGVGGSKNPLEAFRDFRGRDAELQPLLNRRGLG